MRGSDRGDSEGVGIAEGDGSATVGRKRCAGKTVGTRAGGERIVAETAGVREPEAARVAGRADGHGGQNQTEGRPDPAHQEGPRRRQVQQLVNG